MIDRIPPDARIPRMPTDADASEPSPENEILSKLSPEKREARLAEFRALDENKKKLWATQFDLRMEDGTMTFYIKEPGQPERPGTPDEQALEPEWSSLQKKYGRPEGGAPIFSSMGTAPEPRRSADRPAADTEELQRVKQEFESKYNIPIPGSATRSRADRDGWKNAYLVSRDRETGKPKIVEIGKRFKDGDLFERKGRGEGGHVRMRGGVWEEVSGTGPALPAAPAAPAAPGEPAAIEATSDAEIVALRAERDRLAREAARAAVAARARSAPGTPPAAPGAPAAPAAAPAAAAAAPAAVAAPAAPATPTRPAFGTRVGNWFRRVFPELFRTHGLPRSEAVPANMAEMQARYVESRRYVKEFPRAAARVFKETRQGLIAEAEQAGRASLLMRISDTWKKKFPLWKRIGIGALIAGAGVASGGASSLVSLTAYAALAWRATTSAMAAATAAAAAHTYFEKRNSRRPMLWAALSGTLVGAGSFVGSQYAAEYVSNYMNARGIDPYRINGLSPGGPTIVAREITLPPVLPQEPLHPDLVNPIAPRIPEGLPLVAEPDSSIVPEPVTPPVPTAPSGETSLPRVIEPEPLSKDLMPPAPTPRPGVVPGVETAPESPALRPRVEVTPPAPALGGPLEITPELSSVLRQGGLSALVDSEQGFGGIITKFDLSDSAVLQLKDALSRTLTERDFANKLVGVSGDVVRNGSVVFPAEGELDMGLFGDRDFTTRLRSVILENEKTYLTPELGGRQGVGEFIKEMRSVYAR